jgi:serine/threonine protein kinase
MARLHPGSLQPGQTFGPRYLIRRLIGGGGAGAVYEAQDVERGTVVALKLLGADAGGRPARDLERELLIARQISSPHVVRILDIGELNGIAYLTMPYITGGDLADILKHEGRLPIDRVLAISKQVVRGLAAAHATGIVHRDLKPENILIDADGSAVITDLGLASAEPGGTTVTRAGAVMGTLAYMAPEQAQGHAVDPRADLYAFGLVLYDVLGGRWRTSQYEAPMSELMARLNDELPPIKVVAPEVTPALDAIITKCLRHDPADRYQSAGELLKDLEKLDSTGNAVRTAGARGWRAFWWVCAAAALAAAALIWWLAAR